jgi:phosphoglycerate dehydrogenase-like enzyme
MKVHVLKVYDLDFQQQITSNCKNIQIEFGALPQNCDEIEVLITGRPSKEEIERCKNLKYLLIPFSGIPETTKERMKNYPHIAVHNLHHNALSVAENAITFLFFHGKRYHSSSQ